MAELYQAQLKLSLVIWQEDAVDPTTSIPFLSSQMTLHLFSQHCMESNLEDEVCPDDMEDKEDGEEAIEDVIGREHLDHLRSLYCGTETQEKCYACLSHISPII